MTQENEQQLEGHQSNASTLWTRVDSLPVHPTVKQFIKELVAMTHNNALRTYELSCITDGILYAMKEKGVANEIDMQNCVQIATAVKEYYGETKDRLDFLQACELFLGADFELGKQYIKIKTHEFFPKSDEEVSTNG